MYFRSQLLQICQIPITITSAKSKTRKIFLFLNTSVNYLTELDIQNQKMPGVGNVQNARTSSQKPQSGMLLFQQLQIFLNQWIMASTNNNRKSEL